MDDPHPHNTGVMVMDVPAFAREWPLILEYTLEQPSFPLHDQALLNAYFTQSVENEAKRTLLPIFWNWKSYWQLYPNHVDDVKILHFHGPKPGKALEEIGECTARDNHALLEVTSLYADYEPLLLQGICCDQGRSAAWALQQFHEYERLTMTPEEGVVNTCWN